MTSAAILTAKVTMWIWLIFPNGQIAPESIIVKELPSLRTCVTFGQGIHNQFNGVDSYSEAHLVCVPNDT